LNEITLTVIFIITNLYFILRSGLAFYYEKGIRLVLKSLILIVFLKLALEGYRMVLFFVTMGML
jgi:hypothetical protein